MVCWKCLVVGFWEDIFNLFQKYVAQQSKHGKSFFIFLFLGLDFSWGICHHHARQMCFNEVPLCPLLNTHFISSKLKML